MRSFAYSRECFFVAAVGWALLQGCAGSEVDDDSFGGTAPSTGGQGGEGGTPGSGGGIGGGTGGVGGKGGGGTGGALGGGGIGGEPQGGAPPTTCGNGFRDDTEQCEGTDFGGKQCSDFGLGTGTLVCNQFCTIVVSECLPKESCGDGVDNDEDGLTDCLDDECATAVACTDSCGGAQIETIPAFPFANLLGRPNVLTSSCAPAGGSEIVYQVQVPTDGDVSVQFSPFSFDGAFSVRTACEDAATEILCVNNGGNGQTENGSFPGVAGSTYYVIFESATPTGGDFFSGTIDQPQPEDFCDDFWDDDFDGYLDCDDPTSCKGISFSCTPGTKGYAENCFSNTDCVATGGDPVCLGFGQGFPDGYCSEFCDGPGDCPAGGSCVDLGLSVHGVCFKSCSTPADCPNGNECVDLGNGEKVCDKAPELNCQDYSDNDFDSFIDCEDPSCSASFSCAPGPRAVGDTCQIHGQCGADANDPFCIDQSHENWQGGYCSEFCDLANDDCPAGSICSDWFFFSSGNGLCMKTCQSQSDCRSNYSCLDIGLGSDVCIF